MKELLDIYQNMKLDKNVIEFCLESERSIKTRFEEIDYIAEYNQMKVLSSMQKNKISEMHFYASTGYGYNDLGRDALEAVFADVLKTESALVRPQLMSGTHALSVAMFGNLRPGDELLSITGKPYDTLEGVIGIKPSNGSLSEYGIAYKQTDLLPDGEFDYDKIKTSISDKTKMIAIQRSKGYSIRPSLSVDQIGKVISFIKNIKPDVICMVDNCYGEFVELYEPTDTGADLLVGSLIKNPGGGLAPAGGYIAGKNEYVDNASYRLSAPGLGKEVGATLGITQLLFQGLFLAPSVTASAIKGAVFAADLYERLGFLVYPGAAEKRHDIVQAITLNTKKALIAFCRGIQAAAPIDSYVVPEPLAMPGYNAEVIMAAGAFVQGSSIELSADAPLVEPYTVYFQGGLTWHHAKYGIMMSVQKMYDEKLLSKI